MFILHVVQVVCYSIKFITFAFQLSRLTNELCVPFILLLIISNAEGETDTALRRAATDCDDDVQRAND